MYLLGKDFSCRVSVAFGRLLLLLRWGRARRDGVAGGGLLCELALAQAPFSRLDDYLQASGTDFQDVIRAGFHALLICGNVRTGR